MKVMAIDSLILATSYAAAAVVGVAEGTRLVDLVEGVVSMEEVVLDVEVVVVGVAAAAVAVVDAFAAVVEEVVRF